MPVASWFAHHWYPGLMSAVGVSTPTADATLKGTGRMSATGTAVAVSPKAALISARYMEAFGSTSPSASALLKGVGRMAAVGRVNELTQDDVTGALLTAQIEGGLTFRDVLRLMLAVTAGNATGLEAGNPAFKSVDGSKTRVAATYSAGNRSGSSLDPT